MARERALPFAPPWWLSERLITVLTGSLFVATLALPITAASGLLQGPANVPEHWIVLPAVIIAMACLGPSTRARSGIGTALVTLITFLFGSAVATSWTTALSGSQETSAELFLGALLNLGPAGFLFGSMFVPLTVFGVWMRQLKAHEGPDWMLVMSGIWLAGAAALRHMWTPDPLALLTSFVGAASLLAGIARLTLRRAWLRRVARGEVPGMKVVVLEDAHAIPMLCSPMALGSLSSHDAGIVLQVERLRGAYRSVDSDPVVLARVSAKPTRSFGEVAEMFEHAARVERQRALWEEQRQLLDDPLLDERVGDDDGRVVVPGNLRIGGVPAAADVAGDDGAVDVDLPGVIVADEEDGAAVRRHLVVLDPRSTE